MYDQTGSLNDSEQLAGEDFDNLYNYFRNIYKEVTEDDIDGFAADFRGSQEEKDEVLQYYDKFKGDMHQVSWQLLHLHYVYAPKPAMSGYSPFQHLSNKFLSFCLECRSLTG